MCGGVDTMTALIPDSLSWSWTAKNQILSPMLTKSIAHICFGNSGSKKNQSIHQSISQYVQHNDEIGASVLEADHRSFSPNAGLGLSATSIPRHHDCRRATGQHDGGVSWPLARPQRSCHSPEYCTDGTICPQLSTRGSEALCVHGGSCGPARLPICCG